MNKVERFNYLNDYLEELITYGDKFFLSKSSIKLDGFNEWSWHRFMSLVIFYRVYYNNVNKWTIIPKLPMYNGINLFGVITFIDKDVFYNEENKILACQTLVHEAQHDILQFAADRAHNKPGYQWDFLIGDMINNLEIIKTKLSS